MSYNRLMDTYNWQQSDWPQFQYALTALIPSLLSLNEKLGFLRGQWQHLEAPLQTEAMLDVLVTDIIKNADIEGEYLNRHDVRSSIKNKLGLAPQLLPVRDKRVNGMVEMTLHAREHFNKPLTENDLCEWHLMLFSASSNIHLRVGTWRTDEEPMQVVSGHHGRWVVHFEAPPAGRVPDEMKAFIDWFNRTAPGESEAIPYASVRAAIAHLYFESIHPFDDGNGRIGRIIAEKALSQGLGYPVFLSLSQAIEKNKSIYYDQLKKASRSNEITEWVTYFVNIISEAHQWVETQIRFVLNKTQFLDRYQNQMNERQLKVMLRMFKAGVEGFEGGMSAKKYMIIADTSKATATRDLQALVEMGALKEIGEGRSTHYELILLR